MQQDEHQAKAYIANILSAHIESIERHPEGGWRFEANHIPAYGSLLIEDADHFDYCLFDPENNEEVGRHRETMMFTRKNNDHTTLLIEGLYERDIGEHGTADADFEGRYVLADSDNLEPMQASVSNSFALRTIEQNLPHMSYVADALNNARFHLSAALSKDLLSSLMDQARAINRAVAELSEVSNAA